MTDKLKKCPDCERNLQPIKLLDATNVWRSEPMGFFEPLYTSPDAREKLFKKMPIQGIVKGWICDECNRILLYGEPVDG